MTGIWYDNDISKTNYCIFATVWQLQKDCRVKHDNDISVVLAFTNCFTYELFILNKLFPTELLAFDNYFIPELLAFDFANSFAAELLWVFPFVV